MPSCKCLGALKHESPTRLVSHLCDLFLAGRDGIIMALRDVYLDEAGTNEGAKVCVVAGYVGKKADFRKLSRRWNAILRPTGIKCYHATDAQALQGEFRGWSPEKRDQLAARLLPLLPRYAAGIAVGIVLQDFKEAMAARPDLQGFMPEPYGSCFQWLVQALVEMAHKYNSPARFAFVHENNDKKKDAIDGFDWVKKNRDDADNLISLSFAEKHEFVPLQGADILAFEVCRRLANLEGKERRALSALNPGGGKLAIKYYAKNNMHVLIRGLEKVRALHERDQAAIGRLP